MRRIWLSGILIFLLMLVVVPTVSATGGFVPTVSGDVVSCPASYNDARYFCAAYSPSDRQQHIREGAISEGQVSFDFTGLDGIDYFRVFCLSAEGLIPLCPATTVENTYLPGEDPIILSRLGGNTDFASTIEEYPTGRGSIEIVAIGRRTTMLRLRHYSESGYKYAIFNNDGALLESFESPSYIADIFSFDGSILVGCHGRDDQGNQQVALYDVDRAAWLYPFEAGGRQFTTGYYPDNELLGITGENEIVKFDREHNRIFHLPSSLTPAWGTLTYTQEGYCIGRYYNSENQSVQGIIAAEGITPACPIEGYRVTDLQEGLFAIHREENGANTTYLWSSKTNELTPLGGEISLNRCGQLLVGYYLSADGQVIMDCEGNILLGGVGSNLRIDYVWGETYVSTPCLAVSDRDNNQYWLYREDGSLISGGPVKNYCIVGDNVFFPANDTGTGLTGIMDINEQMVIHAQYDIKRWDALPGEEDCYIILGHSPDTYGRAQQYAVYHLTEKGEARLVHNTALQVPSNSGGATRCGSYIYLWVTHQLIDAQGQVVLENVKDACLYDGKVYCVVYDDVTSTSSVICYSENNREIFCAVGLSNVSLHYASYDRIPVFIAGDNVYDLSGTRLGEYPARCMDNNAVVKDGDTYILYRAAGSSMLPCYTAQNRLSLDVTTGSSSDFGAFRYVVVLEESEPVKRGVTSSQTGELILPPQAAESVEIIFDRNGRPLFVETTAQTQEGAKTLFSADGSARVLVEGYDRNERYSESDFLIIYRNGLCGLYDAEGVELLPCAYSAMYPRESPMGVVWELHEAGSSKYGLAAPDGRLIAPCSYSDAKAVGPAQVYLYDSTTSIGGLYHWSSGTLTPIVETKYSTVNGSLFYGRSTDTERYILYHIASEECVVSGAADIGGVGGCPVWVNDGSGYRYYDQDGKLLSNQTFYKAESFTNGFARVWQRVDSKNQVGYLLPDGSIAVNMEYGNGMKVFNSRTWVQTTAGEWLLIKMPILSVS